MKNTSNKQYLILLLFITIVLISFFEFIDFSDNKPLDLFIKISLTIVVIYFLLQKSFRNYEKALIENQEKLHLQSKLTSLGEMLQNISHQWRQPLNALSVLLQNFETMYTLGKLDNTFLTSQIKKGNEIISFMNDTIKNFINFYEPKNNEARFTINESLEKALLILKDNILSKNISIEKNIYEKHDTITYGMSLSQVFLNIISNSIDAITINGIKDGFIIINVIKSEKEYIIEFADNGGGIPKNNLSKIFEPYFTTKHQSSGTGIGLYMSKQIIQMHFKGDIVVANRQNKFDKNRQIGAVISVTLPIL